MFGQRCILPSGPRRPGCWAKATLSATFEVCRADRALGEADPLDHPGDLALAEQLVGLEDVHGAGLDHRRHVLGQREVAARAPSIASGELTTPSACPSGALVSSQMLAPCCQMNAVHLHDGEVVVLAGLVGDAVEVVVERLAGQLVALGARKNSPKFLHHASQSTSSISSPAAGQLLAVLGLDRPPARSGRRTGPCGSRRPARPASAGNRSSSRTCAGRCE